ncbi:MAG TPA: ABC transporter ATP-binding protein [Myxococcota bacterium]|nr:ABC transporter ATP-binding protein [Myxococcota bacterium]
MSGPVLEFENVQVVRGGVTVLDIPALSAPAGELTLVTGENGAGKTTLMLAAGGLVDLARGRISLRGESFHAGRAPAPKRLRRRIAFVFQDPYLFGGSVRSNLTYGLKIRGLDRSKRRGLAEKILARLGIAELALRPANDLSGGERKLVALGRALVLEPEVLYLDEVTASLDDEARARVFELIGSQIAERGTSVLMATHLEGEAEGLATKKIRLHGGRLAED